MIFGYRLKIYKAQQNSLLHSSKLRKTVSFGQNWSVSKIQLLILSTTAMIFTKCLVYDDWQTRKNEWYLTINIKDFSDINLNYDVHVIQIHMSMSIKKVDAVLIAR